MTALSSEELAAIGREAAAATPGPWLADSEPLGRFLQADAVFIAAARTNVPALLADRAALEHGIATQAATIRAHEEQLVILSVEVDEGRRHGVEQAATIRGLTAERDAALARLARAVEAIDGACTASDYAAVRRALGVKLGGEP